MEHVRAHEVDYKDFFIEHCWMNKESNEWIKKALKMKWLLPRNWISKGGKKGIVTKHQKMSGPVKKYRNTNLEQDQILNPLYLKSMLHLWIMPLILL